MKLEFFGDVYATLFTKQLQESLEGGLRENYVGEEEDGFPKGFLRASRKHKVWWDACWTRDAGSFIREIAVRGYLDIAAVCAEFLIDNVDKNKKGFYSFPMYYNREGASGDGDEQDGTANIILGLIELYLRLEDSDSKRKIHTFLTNSSSPIKGIIAELKETELILGNGEFGGGWGVGGLYYNVVQNFMVASALRVYYRYISQESEVIEMADRMYESIKKHFIVDNRFIWCMDENFNEADVSFAPHSNGSANINGIAGAFYDGFYADKSEFNTELRNTFMHLFDGDAHREYLHNTYGMMPYTKAFPSGHSEEFIADASWLAYCECYLAETAVVLGDADLLTKTIRYIVGQTAYKGHMPKSYTEDELLAQDHYWFSERNFSPEWEGAWEEGCGSLNLINIAEPLRLARMIAGLNGTADITPILPNGFSGFKASGYSVVENGNVRYYDVVYDKGELTMSEVNA